jgi:NAD(P)-dependent dehydrogenase (short-subunit alcohol dehydrogenase family)
MKRAGQPAELATAYVMLADPLSSYTSGTTVAVTGGKPFIRMAGLKHPVTPDGRYFVVR